MEKENSAPVLKRRNSIRDNFKQGNTWLICQNSDNVVLKDYEGPISVGHYIMFQSKTITPLKGGRSFGIDRYLLRVDTFGDGDFFTGTVVLCQDHTEGDTPGSDIFSGQDDEVVCIKVKGKVQKDALFVNYPSNSGIDQVYARVAKDDTFEHKAFDPTLLAGSPCRIWRS